jgi:DNA polymerase III delta prime subunit
MGIRPAGSLVGVEDLRDPVEALNWLTSNSNTVLMTHNLHLFMNSAELIQTIQLGADIWKAKGNCLIGISPIIAIPPELKSIFTVIDLPLPDAESLYALQFDLGSPHNIKPNKKAARLARGLTEFEAECAYSLSLVRTKYFSSKVVSEVKSQLIRKSGLLECWEPEDIANVGGLNPLKSYIQTRSSAFSSDNEHLPKPKGILLVGPPGVGKSLSCKAAANILGWPLVRLDIGALKSSLVGESEQKMRQATTVISSFNECVVWVDEIEKAFAGVKSSGETDGGTTSGMFSHFLTWLQENKSPVFVMATANDVSKLPPETLRAGRFDAIFMVDFPSLAERRDIISIMNNRYNADIPLDYAEKLVGWSGSEIEQLARETKFVSLDEAYQSIIPLSRTMREDVTALQKWAKTRARLANTADAEPDVRKIHTGDT